MSEKYVYTSTNHKTHNHLKNKHPHIPTVVPQKTACRALREKIFLSEAERGTNEIRNKNIKLKVI